MSSGESPRVTIRVPVALLAEMDAEIQRSQDRGIIHIYDRSTFTNAAIRAFIQKRKGSRKTRSRKPKPTLPASQPATPAQPASQTATQAATDADLAEIGHLNGW